MSTYSTQTDRTRAYELAGEPTATLDDAQYAVYDEVVLAYEGLIADLREARRKLDADVAMAKDEGLEPEDYMPPTLAYMAEPGVGIADGEMVAWAWKPGTGDPGDEDGRGWCEPDMIQVRESDLV